MLSELTDYATRWMDSGDHTPLTRSTTLRTLRQFAAFAEAHDVHSPHDVAPQLVEAFLTAPTPRGTRPARATQHQRRSALRAVFRQLETEFPEFRDPTDRIDLGPRTDRVARPLTDVEMELCRDAALSTNFETRLPAVLALAEASGMTAEIAVVQVSDVDLDAGTVWLCGTKSALPRFGRLSEWGVRQLARRLSDLSPQQTGVAYNGTAAARGGQTGMTSALARVFAQAGIAGEPGVVPTSVRCWAARKRFEETGRIEDAARMLGCRSLDVAARHIGFVWRDGPVP